MRVQYIGPQLSRFVVVGPQDVILFQRQEIRDVPDAIATSLLEQPRIWRPAETPQAEVELTDMTVAELRDLAELRDIDIPAKALKAEIIERIEAGEASDDDLPDDGGID